MNILLSAITGLEFLIDEDPFSIWRVIRKNTRNALNFFASCCIPDRNVGSSRLDIGSYYDGKPPTVWRKRVKRGRNRRSPQRLRGEIENFARCNGVVNRVLQCNALTVMRNMT